MLRFFKQHCLENDLEDFPFNTLYKSNYFNAFNCIDTLQLLFIFI
jgi:hypothetical protein